ncbi:glycosyltransferase family 4 protein [Saccharicrinis sp. GN24d3]|uniref:glycosyltransferase family 4 protein n=1 Tax=Saccharicrinis sp. GN24d3 TaxID=3458416 RepID=UPI0040359110
MSTKQFLYLYREVNPYNIPVLREIVKQGYEVTCIHETKKKLVPYNVPELKNVTFYERKDFDQVSLNQLVLSIEPNVAYVSDITIPMYNKAAKLLRKTNGTPVIMGFDTQWRGGRQWANVITSWFRHRLYFSHVLIAGMRQYEYAKRLGFKNNQILWPLNSADVDTFLKVPLSFEKFKGHRKFLYVGRFANVKGLKYLLEAWSGIKNKKGATLTLVGNGPLRSKLESYDDVIIRDFMSQEELVKLGAETSCFVLPSTFEPWALVIHEFAAAGLPLLLTNACGAASHFLINNYNGFLVNSNSHEQLRIAMEKVINSSDKKLFEFGERSREFAKSITPKMVAYAITSAEVKSI